MLKITPSILTNNLIELREMITRCKNVTNWVQIDIVDGIYANNKTIDPSLITNLDTEVNLDFHLMVKEPINWVEKCANAGADRIIGQIEMMDNQVDFVGKIQSLGIGVGLAIDLATPVSQLDPVVLTNLDVVLVMAVKAGFGGQKLDERVYEKIRQLDEIRIHDSNPYAVCVDGGETEDVIDNTRIAGADEVVVGRRIFDGNMKDNLERFEKAAYGRLGKKVKR